MQHYSLLIGTAMCGMGIVIFLNFSAQDFLTPGFIEKGIILENVELKGSSSTSGVIHVDEIGKPYVVILSNNGSPTKFDVKIDGSQGEVLHDTIFKNGEIRFTPDMKGDYAISIKNESGNPTSVSLNYGLTHDYTQTSLMMSVLWVLLIIGGNYLILHKHFTNKATA
jgi:uncharacterized protein YfaS (alpha-2-macroglobulin family)